MFSRLASSFLLLAALVRANSHDHAAADHNLRAQRLAKKQDGARVFNLVDSAEGPNFFDSWAFMTFDDPTHGLVQYVDRDTAFAKGLAYVRDDGVAVMRVDNTTWLADGQKKKQCPYPYCQVVWSRPVHCRHSTNALWVFCMAGFLEQWSQLASRWRD